MRRYREERLLQGGFTGLFPIWGRDSRELARRLSPKQLAAADPDHDGTLTKDEYLAVVEQRFRNADPDHDGTLDAKELNSAAARPLLRLLR